MDDKWRDRGTYSGLRGDVFEVAHVLRDLPGNASVEADAKLVGSSNDHRELVHVVRMREVDRIEGLN